MKIDENTFMSVDDLTKVLHCCKSKAYEIVAQDDFPSIKIGRTYVIPREKFEKWVEHNIYKSYSL